MWLSIGQTVLLLLTQLLDPLNLNYMTLPLQHYLVVHGNSGLWMPCTSTTRWHRNDEVILRSERGLEPGTIRSTWLRDTIVDENEIFIGSIIGPMTQAFRKDWTAASMKAELALSNAQQLAKQLRLPIEVIDVEPVLDPFTLILHILQTGPVDSREFVSRISKATATQIRLHDLTQPHTYDDDHGCGSCGTGCGCQASSNHGGCSTGCGSTIPEEFEKNWQAYFAQLRTNMENRKISLPM